MEAMRQEYTNDVYSNSITNVAGISFEEQTDALNDPISKRSRSHLVFHNSQSHRLLGSTYVRSYNHLSFSSTIEFHHGSHENESPFYVLDQYSAKDKRILKAIQLVNQFTGFPYQEKLINRLTFLLEEEKDENPTDWLFSQQSLSEFLTFLASHQDLKYPDVCLTFDGLIQAQWRAGKNRNLVLEFLKKDEIQFVLLAPRDKRTLQLTGIGTQDDVWFTIEVYGAEKWCKR